jgi:UDPglucose 6-dehydrogenase
LQRNLTDGGVRFHTDFATLVDREVVFVCVPTPTAADGASDLSAVDDSCGQLAAVLRCGSVVVVKSTVPVGTSDAIAEKLAGSGIAVVSAPEFLREGRAVADFQHPHSVVIGAADRRAGDLAERVLDPGGGATRRMSLAGAELAKYACNAFLAVKLSYVNSLARLCTHAGADIADVTDVMGADPRIGAQFLQPGPGWGGSCLPKDTLALMHIGRLLGVSLPEVAAARETNAFQRQRICEAIEHELGRGIATARVAALGLAFKAGTSDVRDSPALTLCARLGGAGARTIGYDPRLSAIDSATLRTHAIVAVDDPYRAVDGADVILILTEWPHFRELDWGEIGRCARGALVFDTRNLLDRHTVEAGGLRYLGNGVAGGY